MLDVSPRHDPGERCVNARQRAGTVSDNHFRRTYCTDTSIASCAVLSNQAAALTAVRAPHHPSSSSLSDRNAALTQSVHYLRPVGGLLPLSQLRIHDSRHSVTKLKLLYTPFTGSTPLQFGGAYKVHHV